MKKYWLCSLLALASLGCSREQVAPATLAATAAQPAEAQPDCYATLSPDGTLSRYYYSRDGETHRDGYAAKIVYTRDGSFLVVADESGEGWAAVSFEAPLKEPVRVAVRDAQGSGLFEQLVEPGSLSVSLRGVVMKAGQFYTVQASQQNHTASLLTQVDFTDPTRPQFGGSAGDNSSR